MTYLSICLSKIKSMSLFETDTVITVEISAGRNKHICLYLNETVILNKGSCFMVTDICMYGTNNNNSGDTKTRELLTAIQVKVNLGLIYML